MKLNTKILISFSGVIIVIIAVAILAVASGRLVDSITTGESGSGDWSIDENEFSNL